MIYENKIKKTFSKKLKRVFAMIIIMVVMIMPCQQLFAVIRPPNLPVSVTNDDFPDSYKPYIEKLKQLHPNWTFKAVHTNLDWNLVMQHESYDVNMGISTVHQSKGPEWKKDGKNYTQDGPYVTASKQAVAYVMDPRNFLTEDAIFQFESLSFSKQSHTVDAVNSVLSNTPMGKEYSSQYKNNGSWINMGKTYAQIIMEKGEKYGVSPIHIASRMKQETSGDVVNNLSINGSYPGYTGLYNFFNIGATPDANGQNSIRNGLIYASKQNPVWNTPENSIDAGVDVLRNSYIKWGQDTIYFQKFDVNNPGQAKFLFQSQYMTNILAPVNEAYSSYQAYKKAGLLDLSFEFHIPVYKNMPTYASPYPSNSEEGTFEEDNTWVYLDDTSDTGVSDIFNIRSSPDDSSNDNIIEKWVETKEGAENRTKFLRIGKGVGIQWDKIKLPDGRIGYIFTGKGYVKVYDYTKVQSISLNQTTLQMQNNKTQQLKATIQPTNAFIKDVTWESSDSSIVSVDAQGNITSKKTGSAVITVRTTDQAKTASCTVNVVNPHVESITLSTNEYKVIKGNSIRIEPTVLPATATNKNYRTTIEYENILTLENGVFKAVSAGTTKVTFTTEDGNKSVVAVVEVIDAIGDIVIDNSLRVEGTQISKLSPETTVEQLKKKITTSLRIEFLDSKGNALKNENLVGTGTRICIYNNNTLKYTYTVILYGDVNGDGKINIFDSVAAQKHLAQVQLLEPVFVKAGSALRKNNQITIFDIGQIEKHIAQIVAIEQ